MGVLDWLLESTECTVKVERIPKGGGVYVVAGNRDAEKLVLDRTVDSNAVLVVILCEEG